MEDRFVMVARNGNLVKQLKKIAEEIHAEMKVFNSPDEVELSEPPTAIVIEVEIGGAIEAIAAWRKKWPDCFLCGTVSYPTPELWHGALAAGCHLVTNQGAFPAKFLERLEGRSISGDGSLVPGRRIPARMNEFQGDGLAGSVPDAPDGELAIYRIEGNLYAVRDICPHAGELLSNGCFESGIITCPLHGSQFDVRTGERTRGPADIPIRTYRIIAEGAGIVVEV